MRGGEQRSENEKIPIDQIRIATYDSTTIAAIFMKLLSTAFEHDASIPSDPAHAGEGSQEGRTFVIHSENVGQGRKLGRV